MYGKNIFSDNIKYYYITINIVTHHWIILKLAPCGRHIYPHQIFMCFSTLLSPLAGKWDLHNPLACM